MKTFLTFMKRNYKILVAVIALSASLFAFKIYSGKGGDPEKDKLLLELISFVILKCDKKGEWKFDNKKVETKALKQKTDSFPSVQISFDRDCSYGLYIQQKVFLETQKINVAKEFVY